MVEASGHWRVSPQLKRHKRRDEMDAAKRQRIVDLSAQERLMIGCCMGDEDVWRGAIHAGADVNLPADLPDIDDFRVTHIYGVTPLVCTIVPYKGKSTGHARIANLLLAAGADPKEYGALVNAAAQGHASIVSAPVSYTHLTLPTKA